MSIPCGMFSISTHGGYFGLSNVLDTLHVIKRSNTAFQTSI